MTDQKSDLQPGRTPESEPNHPETEPELGLALRPQPAPYKSLPGPSGPEPQKVSERDSRGLPAPGSKECLKQSKNSLWSLKTVSFETPEIVLRLFRTLLRPRGPEQPGDSLGDFWGFQARRARETPARGGRGRKFSCFYRNPP